MASLFEGGHWIGTYQDSSLPLYSLAASPSQRWHKLRSGADDQLDAAATRSQLQSDVSPVRENEALQSELMKMKPYISDMQKNQGSSTKGIAAAAPTTTGYRKHTFFSSMSKTLGS
ncbi:hypothetical protein OIU77_000855 [Salix suchowensis]|uniref:Uncharacterized protein n=1 Tax=Salix suchowensis TaxID=1278906 RepID=A0ABQ9B7L2_9ROSI|nr:hypothetical protein OIU77_000855 [Salix suchowensis]